MLAVTLPPRLSFLLATYGRCSPTKIISRERRVKILPGIELGNERSLLSLSLSGLCPSSSRVSRSFSLSLSFSLSSSLLLFALFAPFL